MTAVSKATKNKNVDKSEEKETIEKNGKTQGKVKNRFGPLPTFPHQKVWTRCVIVLSVLVYVWYTSKEGKITTLARQKETLQNRGSKFLCDAEYVKEISNFPECIPAKCGRFVNDKIVTNNEAETLLTIAKTGISLGGSSGGASILDLHSGALSYKEVFLNIYAIEAYKKIITPAHLAIYNMVKEKIKMNVAGVFGIDPDHLYLTSPTFFSQLTNVEPKTQHDEYWLTHVDKVTYEFFDYTALVYLNDYGIDFKGGRLTFIDGPVEKPTNVTIEPRKGRVAFFTSGAENPHFVERVTSGTRYALTVSFTCDPSKGISDLKVKQ